MMRLADREKCRLTGAARRCMCFLPFRHRVRAVYRARYARGMITALVRLGSFDSRSIIRLFGAPCLTSATYAYEMTDTPAASPISRAKARGRLVTLCDCARNRAYLLHGVVLSHRRRLSTSARRAGVIIICMAWDDSAALVAMCGIKACCPASSGAISRAPTVSRLRRQYRRLSTRGVTSSVCPRALFSAWCACAGRGTAAVAMA